MAKFWNDGSGSLSIMLLSFFRLPPSNAPAPAPAVAKPTRDPRQPTLWNQSRYDSWIPNNTLVLIPFRRGTNSDRAKKGGLYVGATINHTSTNSTTTFSRVTPGSNRNNPTKMWGQSADHEKGSKVETDTTGWTMDDCFFLFCEWPLVRTSLFADPHIGNWKRSLHH